MKSEKPENSGSASTNTQGGSKSFEVGYGKPPSANQFKPGKSGNPKGRPKGSSNVANALKELFTGSIAIREGNRIRHISRLEALSYKQMERGLKGDLRAAEATFKTARLLGLFNEPYANSEYDLTVLTDEELCDLDRITTKALKKNLRKIT